MTLPFLLLGLLTDQPLSGYDLNKLFEATASHFWTAEQSQIYRALHTMVERGWVQAETIVQQGAPNKKVYHVTEAGQDALRAWLQTPFEQEPPRETWLGQLFFADHLADEQVRPLLHTYADYLRQQLAALQTVFATLAPLRTAAPSRRLFYRLLTLEYGIARHQFELTWIEQVIMRLESSTYPSTDA